MDCRSQHATDAPLHPPAAQATPGVRFPGNRQTLPGEVGADGSGEAPRCRPRSHSSIVPGEKAEEHMFERQRELHRSMNAGLEEVPEWDGAGFGLG